MSELVIDLLEMIDIHDQHGDMRFLAQTQTDQIARTIMPSMSVHQTTQGIDFRQFLDPQLHEFNGYAGYCGLETLLSRKNDF
ncbi:hypothetical protein, partial [Rhizobium sp. SL86]|uniref:hypothetical protein n=1 Tax=Rhizobium sp. SL86 TaxID=2995148 RepID=UPI002276E8F4